MQARLVFPGRALLRGLTLLPIVCRRWSAASRYSPPSDAAAWSAQWLDAAFGMRLPFTTAGAVLAETFVAMPFFVLTMEGAFARRSTAGLEDAARTLGAGPWRVFWSVTLPLVRPSLVAGAVLCWARALGEFGATITFAGNFPGRTQTVPLAVYLLLESRPEAGIALSLVLVVVSLAVLVVLRDRWVRAL